MTTIAWDGKSIAADRDAWIGDVVVKTRKLARIRYRGDLAIAGRFGKTHITAPVVEWLARDCKGDRPPAMGEDGAVLLWTHDGLYIVEGNIVLYQIQAPFFACGLGGPMAMGALAAGANARTAIEIVVEHGAGASGGVDVMNLEP